MPVDLRTAYLTLLREGSDAFVPECLEYIFHLIYNASFQGKGFRDLPAAELCRTFHRQAAADFGALAGEAVERFGLRTYEDLGKAVFHLAKQGCLTLRDGESLESYAALGPIRFDREPDTTAQDQGSNG